MIDSTKLSDEIFSNFARLTYEKSGIVLKENKKTLLANRLRKRVKQLGLSDFEQYWLYLKKPEKSTREMFHFLAAVSTNETYFERSPVHFEILREHILPELYREGSRQISLWSCGCSTGEETYNLAMTAIEEESRFNLFSASKKRGDQLLIDVIGTDISHDALKIAQLGEYADRRIAKLSSEQRDRYFEPLDTTQTSLLFAKDILRVKKNLREKVVFQYLNLKHDAYLFHVDVIFCRNVLIYFDQPTVQSIVDRFTESLNPGGYLILGHSESLQTFHTELEQVRLERATIYRKALS